MAYCTTAQVRLKCGLTTAEISEVNLGLLIPFADEEIDQTVGQAFGEAIAVTEYYSLYPPKRADDVLPNRILLNHYPVMSVTSFVIMTSTSTVITALDTLSAGDISAKVFQAADYYCDAPTGIVELSTTTFEFVPRRAKIAHLRTHGCASNRYRGFCKLGWNKSLGEFLGRTVQQAEQLHGS